MQFTDRTNKQRKRIACGSEDVGRDQHLGLSDPDWAQSLGVRVRFGVVFPQTELSSFSRAVRGYISGISALGYEHVMLFEHVMGGDPTVHDLQGPYTIDDRFHEPFVLMGFLAAISNLELITGLVVLPQRQTALVAKQAAEVDILSQGRLRLGVGIGWNAAEYEALGMDFHTRGARFEEQIGLLRAMWTQRRIDFRGRFHQLTGVGIAPLPEQRPVPIWIGSAGAEVGLRRVGRVGDGFIPELTPGSGLDRQLSIVRDSAERAGRSASDLALLGRVRYGDGDLGRIRREIEGWRQARATHVAIDTIGIGSESVDEHLTALSRVRRVLE